MTDRFGVVIGNCQMCVFDNEIDAKKYYSAYSNGDFKTVDAMTDSGLYNIDGILLSSYGGEKMVGDVNVINNDNVLPLS